MTSSNDTSAEPLERVRHALAGAGARAGGVAVRSGAPIRVIDRAPPPPPAPRIDVAPLARSLDAGFRALKAQVDASFAEIERECVELAIGAAEALTRARCERGELALEEPLRALLSAKRRELEQLPALLRLHPADAEPLAGRLAELAPAGARVELLQDPASPRGQLALEIGAARVVWSLGEELAQLRRALLEGGARS